LLTQNLEVALLTVELIETDVCLDGDTGAGIAQVRVAARYDSEPLALRLPREIKNSVLELDNLNGIVLLTDTEDLEVAEDRLLRLGVAVDLDAEEIALVLPVELTLYDRIT
jgi:hypothetical protein